MKRGAERCFSLLLYSGAAVGGIWLAVRFFLPWLAPFIVAFTLAALMEPLVCGLTRLGWRRGLAAGMLTLVMLALVVWALASAASWVISTATGFAGQVPELMAAAGDALERMEQSAQAYIAAAPNGLGEYMSTAMASLGDVLYSLPARASGWVLDALAKAAQSSPDVLLFAVTAGIGTYFISASFPGTVSLLKSLLPPGLRRRLDGLGGDMRNNLGGLLRAQLLLMAMTFFELLTVFLLMGIDGAAGLAALTALIDALPVFGTGTVLLPWALYCLLLGNGGRALALTGCWAGVNLVRSCAQAKLMGDRIGLDPLTSLVAIYVGWRVCGVWGMLLFPLGFSMLRLLAGRGIVTED